MYTSYVKINYFDGSLTPLFAVYLLHMAAKNGECHLKIKQLTIKFYLIGLCGCLRSEKFCGYLRSEKFCGHLRSEKFLLKNNFALFANHENTKHNVN